MSDDVSFDDNDNDNGSFDDDGSFDDNDNDNDSFDDDHDDDDDDDDNDNDNDNDNGSDLNKKYNSLLVKHFQLRKNMNDTNKELKDELDKNKR